MYQNFSTYAKGENQELENWAQSKKIYEQDKNKQQEFLDYKNQKIEALREVFIEVIKEKYKELKS
jgi:hypothetical protein